MVTIEGTVEEIVYSNEINGYTVCEIKSEKDTITAVGYMPFICAGEILKVSGKWVTHPDYGEQLKVEGYEKLLPQNADEIEKYLSSGVVKGIGPVTASKLVERFGEDTLNIIQFHSERLSEVKGISLDKAMKIGQAFEEQRGLRKVIMFLQEYGISTALSTKIYKAFGEKTIDEIRKNPFCLTEEEFNLGFKKADIIAKNLGIDPSSQYRVSSGIKYVLSQASRNGHAYLPEDKFKPYTCSLLDIEENVIDDSLVSMVFSDLIIIERKTDPSRIYLKDYFKAEAAVCRKLIELSAVNFKGDLNDFEEKINQVQSEENLILAKRQVEAVKEALLNGVLVITGGPGTGKTTIIKSIIKLLKKEGYEVALAAPTGRAAKRMTEATGEEAKTIHRLLEIGFGGSEADLAFARNDENPIEADVVIIDEMSMVDIMLMNSLLEAIAPGTRLILVGDVDQLPSVGAGNVLKDIISSGRIKTVKLDEIFRQAEESMIIVNAHRINRGEHPRLNQKDKDFFFMPRRNGEDVLRAVIELCSRRLPSTYGYDPLRQIQVLTPTRKGIVGVYNLNVELQKVLNPFNRNLNEKSYGGYVFREGDRVMQVRNNYNLRWEKSSMPGNDGAGVFNGDTGIIKSIDDELQKIIVQFEDDKIVEYDFGILDEIEPAFALTIHKSQGSEFPVVVLPIFPGPQILMTRNLLYTAVTRAKNLVILVGSEDTLREMINNEKETLRYSGLNEKMKTFLTQF